MTHHYTAPSEGTDCRFRTPIPNHKKYICDADMLMCSTPPEKRLVCYLNHVQRKWENDI